MSVHSVMVRPIASKEIAQLKNFLYAAIFVPPGINPPDFSVVELPQLRAYVEAFGSRRGDLAVAADRQGELIGAAWCRILPEYKWLGQDTPMLAIAVLPNCRGQGTGTALLGALLHELRCGGYRGLALSVQRQNPAVRLYQRMGFEIVTKKGDEWLMRLSFHEHKK